MRVGIVLRIALALVLEIVAVAVIVVAVVAVVAAGMMRLIECRRRHIQQMQHDPGCSRKRWLL